MTQTLVAGVIGAAFGLVFVVANAGAPVGTGLSDAVRAAAIAAFAVVAVMLAVLRRRRAPHARQAHTPDPDRNLFRRR